MSWLNFNESLSNIKGQISNFASGVLAEGIVNDTDPFTELSAASQKIQELQNLCASQDVEIASLRRQNTEYLQKISAATQSKSDRHASAGDNGAPESWFWDPPTTDARENNTANTISDLTNKIKELETEKKDLVQSLEQLDLDCQRTTEKLVTLKDDLQIEYNKLKVDFDWIKTENEELIKENKRLKTGLANQNKHLDSTDDYKKLYNDLKINFENVEQQNLSLECSNKDLSVKLLNLESQNSDLSKLNSESSEKHNKLLKDFELLQSKHTELEILNKSMSEKNQKLSNEISKVTQNNNLSDDYKKLKDDELLIEKQELHKKYVTILSEMVKKYVDYQIPEDFIQKQNESAEISEFNSKVESVLKLLLDFKWKTETLERKLCEISHEKTVAITEKNHEIEKLLHNSEILSQEVITKTQTIKDYEIECSELIKNNDLLIAELQQYKNNGLQTISESNEDNMLLLETQLEQSNKRIKELELVINDLENSKQETNLETQTELDYIKKQLNMTGNELSQSKTEYKELLKLFKQLEIDNKSFIAEINKLKSNCDLKTGEKNSLQSLVDKLKIEIENTEYKFTETNVNFESLKEELQSCKIECSNLSNNNENLISINKELNNKLQILNSELDSLKNQLETILNIKNKVETQNRNLTEKLQSSKMSETGLKLQNDTIKRELDLMTELNSNLDQKLKNLEQEYLQISKTFQSLQSCNILQDISLDNNMSIVQKLDLLKNKFKNIQQNNSNNLELNNLLDQNSQLINDKQNLESNLLDLQNKFENDSQQFENTIKNLEQHKLFQENELLNCNNQIEQLSSQISNLQQEINSLNISKAELVQFVTAKHEENIKYHSEIQRLNQLITLETEKCINLELQLSNTSTIDQSSTIDSQRNEIEKLADQNSFLKEKCEKLAQNLLEEQSNTQKILSERQNISEREQSLTKELERLRMHLVEIEDTYTKELVLAEEKNKEMLVKVNEIEQRERDSSTIYTSVSIRANQQVETLQNQLQLVTAQRDDLQKKMSEAEDKNNKQFAALTNLQCVLEQFQRDREKDILSETERIRRQISVEQQKQTYLSEEINTLKCQLEESKQGLKAASRLTDQIEKSKQQALQMKEEVNRLQEHLSKTEEKYNKLSSETCAKVDKNLIKNLIVGFISANNNLNKDQTQILKIISTVLDFSQQDNDKLNLNKNSGSWLNSILHPMAGNSNISQQSLSEAFVRFLESESQPKSTPPPLLNMRKMSTESNASSVSNTRQNPLLLSEVVLPTFADFAQNRNSSSILKDVLKEN